MMMKKFIYLMAPIMVSCLSLSFVSCATSKSSTTLSKGASLSDYKYIVFGNANEGDADMADVLLMVQNELSGKLKALSREEAQPLIEQGVKVLSPTINVKSEKWDDGQTFITINFHDYVTHQLVAVVKSGGATPLNPIGQNPAFMGIKKELKKAFK